LERQPLSLLKRGKYLLICQGRLGVKKRERLAASKERSLRPGKKKRIHPRGRGVVDVRIGEIRCPRGIAARGKKNKGRDPGTFGRGKECKKRGVFVFLLRRGDFTRAPEKCVRGL